MSAARWELSGAAGRWSVRAADAATARQALECAERNIGPSLARFQGPVSCAGSQAWLKGAPLRGRAAWRHGWLRRLGVAAPREREFANARWLRARLFRAPEPIAAAVLCTGLGIDYQFLLMQRLEGQLTFEAALEAADTPQRLAWTRELAFELARMHALGFAHGDLYPRNVLVRREIPSSGDPRALTFVDAWRRNAATRAAWLAARRGESRWFARDLACWLSYAVALQPEHEWGLWWRCYGAERAAQGRAVRALDLVAAIQRAYAGELARIDGDKGRWRSSRAPVRDWDARRLLDAAPDQT